MRGAKLHQTGALNSHEIIVMPTQTLAEEDRDYAVAFAVPADAPGILMIYGRQPSDTRKLEGGQLDVGNREFGGHEAVIVLDDVFVPWERVFMAGETAFSGLLVERFAGYHRQSYGGCKTGVGDVLIGAAQALAQYQGTDKASHIKDKIVEMVHLNETMYACGIACSAEGRPTASGTYLIDLLLANVCKLNVTRFPYEIARLAQDIAGGLLVTLPSEQDLAHPEVGPYPGEVPARRGSLHDGGALPNAAAAGESHAGAGRGGLSHGVIAWGRVAAGAEDHAGAAGRPGGEDAAGEEAGGNTGATPAMTHLLEEIKHDVKFVKSHSLQPKWYKALKVAILLGFLVGYGCLFGLARTAIFFASFLSLSFLVHLLYRAKTQRWQRSWLDFVVAEENGKIVAKSIGKFYYSAIVFNAILSVVISQVLPPLCVPLGLD